MQLVAIDASNWRAAARVTVTDDQLAFVAAYQPVALVILAKSYVRAGGWAWDPLAVVDDDGAIVGVAALAARSPSSVELFHLAIDQAAQRRGLGTTAVELAVRRAIEQGFAVMELTVDPHNETARQLYERVGFVATGATRDGEPVLRRLLRDEPS